MKNLVFLSALLFFTSCSYTEKEKAALLRETVIAIDSVDAIKMDLKIPEYSDEGDFELIKTRGMLKATLELLDESKERMESALLEENFSEIEEELSHWKALTFMVADKKAMIDSLTIN